MTAQEFIRSIINDRPWEPKQTDLNRLTRGYMQTNRLPESDHERVKKELIQAIEELQYRGELKILAGLGWATGSVEFIFQASRY